MVGALCAKHIEMLHRFVRGRVTNADEEEGGQEPKCCTKERILYTALADCEIFAH
jgi:hypothetical protein